MKPPLSREELMAQARKASRAAYSLLMEGDFMTFLEADKLVEYANQIQEAALELQKRPAFKRTAR